MRRLKMLFQAVDNDKLLENYKMFGKTKADVDDDVAIITKWFETQPHLPEIMDKRKIASFLCMTKFSIEKAKQKIEMYYSIRSKLPHLYDDMNPKLPHLKTVAETSIVALHPILLEGKYRVVFFKNIPGKMDFLNLLRTFYNSFELRLQEDCMFGDIIIGDAGTTTIVDIANNSPILIAQSVEIYQKVVSMPIKGIYLINSPKLITSVIAILKKTMTPKTFARIHVHYDDSILKELFTQDFLPKDFGGNGPSLLQMNDMLQAKFDQYKDRFDKLDTLRVDETLRPEKLENDDILGFYGNFKKLSFD